MQNVQERPVKIGKSAENNREKGNRGPARAWSSVIPSDRRLMWEHTVTANPIQQARRGARPRFLHNFFRLSFLARVAFRQTGISGLLDEPVSPYAAKRTREFTG
jgi:hypothetical protein